MGCGRGSIGNYLNGSGRVLLSREKHSFESMYSLPALRVVFAGLSRSWLAGRRHGLGVFPVDSWHLVESVSTPGSCPV